VKEEDENVNGPHFIIDIARGTMRRREEDSDANRGGALLLLKST
jgi:hypothetical protein